MTVTQVWCPDSELSPWLPLCQIGMLVRLGGGLLRQRNSQHQRPINMAVYSRKMNQAAAYQKGKVQVSCLRQKVLDNVAYSAKTKFCFCFSNPSWLFDGPDENFQVIIWLTFRWPGIKLSSYHFANQQMVYVCVHFLVLPNSFSGFFKRHRLLNKGYETGRTIYCPYFRRFPERRAVSC